MIRLAYLLERAGLCLAWLGLGLTLGTPLPDGAPGMFICAWFCGWPLALAAGAELCRRTYTRRMA